MFPRRQRRMSITWPDQAEWKDYTLYIDVKTGKRHTFREFMERVQYGMTALGAPVVQGGLGFGTREDGEMIGIMSQNSVVRKGRQYNLCLINLGRSQDYIALMHSLVGLPTPFASIPWYSKPFELKHALELSKCTRLFVNSSLLPLVLPMAEKVGIPSSKVYVLGGTAKGRKSFSELVVNAQTKRIPAIAVRPAAKDTLAYLVFSSGTTGLPKGWCGSSFIRASKSLNSSATAVMISHGNLIFTIVQAVAFGTALANVYTVSYLFIYLPSKAHGLFTASSFSYTGRTTNGACIPTLAPQLWPPHLRLPLVSSAIHPCAS
jgi:acyl-CoA synthetase (AMP-forming)/AMP-acid ligase II